MRTERREYVRPAQVSSLELSAQVGAPPRLDNVRCRCQGSAALAGHARASGAHNGRIDHARALQRELDEEEARARGEGDGLYIQLAFRPWGFSG